MTCLSCAAPRRIRPWRLLVLLILLLLLGGVAVVANGPAVPPADLAVLDWVRAHRYPAFDAGMLALTYLGSTMILLPLELGFLCWLLSRRRMGVPVFLSAVVGGAGLLNFCLKGLFERSRPSPWEALVQEHSYSFPSGHAMHTMALMLGLAIVFRQLPGQRPAVLCGLVFVLLVGVSRVVLGVHYPTDVLGGWLAAMAWVTACTLPFRRSLPVIAPPGGSGHAR